MTRLLTAAVAALAFAVCAHAEDRHPRALDVSIAVFDAGIPEDPALYRDLEVFPRVRKIEAMFLPFVLRETLVESKEWGAVRVVPAPEPAAEVLVTGAIVHSDGETLRIRIRARDASGRTWFEQLFESAVTDDYATSGADAAGPAQQRLFDAVAAELVLARNRLDGKALAGIAETSLLRYGYEIAPRAFGSYFDFADDGSFTLVRLPSLDDPMLERVELVRHTEYVITDAVDAKYRELGTEIAHVYDVWREYRRKTLAYRAEDARHAEAVKSYGEPGSFEALRNSYESYKYHRDTEQELDRLAIAFNNEVGPTVEAMETRIAEMRDWVDAKYAEWHRILEEYFELETGASG